MAWASTIAGCSSAASAPAGAQVEDSGGPTRDAGGSATDTGNGGAVDASSRDAGASTARDAASGEEAATSEEASAPEAGVPEAAAPSRESLVWVWMDYPDSLAAVAANASSFTHISPSLYDLNYAYSSGVANLQSGNDSFDGLSSTQIASQIHAGGMKCIPLIQAGAGNGGTDQGIQNVVGDSPSGAQASFISSMVQEAVTKGYDGYSLDWETGGGTTYATYGKPLVTFLGAFQAALHQHGMVLTLIVGDWYVQESDCSGETGYVNLAAAAPNVDQIIMMAYYGSLGTPTASCTSTINNPQNCGNDFGTDLNLMCAFVPEDKISIGFESDPSGNNPIAGSCVSATQASGIPAVAIWPASGSGSYTFCDTTSISPSGTTWFELLAGFVADQ